MNAFANRWLADVTRLASDPAQSKHQRYLAIYRLMHEGDAEIDPIFDTLRRSTAIRQIVSFRLNGLVSAEELGQFSPELVGRVETLPEIYRRPI